MKKVELTSEQEQAIIDNAHSGKMSISKLSSTLGLGRTVVRSFIVSNDLQKFYDTHKAHGRKRDWTDEETYELSLLYDDRKVGIREIAGILNRSKDEIMNRASELGITKKRKMDISDEQIKDIMNSDGSLEEIERLANKYSLTIEGMRLRYQRVHRGYKKRHEYKEFPDPIPNDLLEMLHDYKLTAKEVSRKTGYSPYKVRDYRRDLKDFKIRKDYNVQLSEPEIQCIEVLEELDFAFIPHKRIETYYVDFYLGKHKYIEIQGYPWHSRRHQIDKDNRKKQWLEDNGYVGLYIDDVEFNDKEKVKQKIEEFINGRYKTP